MSEKRALLSQHARVAMGRGDLAALVSITQQLQATAPHYADTHYLAAHAALAQQQWPNAVRAFKKCIQLDRKRLDALVELADLHLKMGRHGDSYALLAKRSADLALAPRPAFMAGELMTKLGMHVDALPLFRAANTLQPEVDSIQAGLAACATKNGELGLAQQLYTDLLQRNPNHQRNHYELSRLVKAADRKHVDSMLGLLGKNGELGDVFLHYAIAKELEDLESWEESFDHYHKGAQQAGLKCQQAGYSVQHDIDALGVCEQMYTKQWIQAPGKAVSGSRCPIFVVGLPRTGTTLVERILSSHPLIETADETFFMQSAVARGSKKPQSKLAEQLEAASQAGDFNLAANYMDAVEYRVAEQPFVVDKYPFNFHYLGLIARYLQGAKIVLLERNPMDACVAMFKQPFFNYSFNLDDLGQYYVAYRSLMDHWLQVLPNIHVVKYETLTTDTHDEIEKLLAYVGVESDPACHRFYENSGASATASSVQIREKMHTRSVDKWRKWENQLDLLSNRLKSNGIAV